MITAPSKPNSGDRRHSFSRTIQACLSSASYSSFLANTILIAQSVPIHRSLWYMTFNTKAAESVQVAPYLTHAVSHHGRITLIPPENAGRTRKTSKLQGKKEKKPSRRLGERSAGSEDNEEARFNLGTPRSVRSVASGTSTRRRPPRSADENRSRGREAGGYGEGDFVLC